MRRYLNVRRAELGSLVAIENVRLRGLHVVVQNEIFLHRVLHALDGREKTLVLLRKSSELARHLVRHKYGVFLTAFSCLHHRLPYSRDDLIEIKCDKSSVAFLNLRNHLAIAECFF